MKIVQKGNRQARVEDERLQEMLDAGYVEIDPKTGKPIGAPKSASDDIKALKKEIKDLKKERDELAKEGVALKEELDELKAQLEAASPNGSGSEPPKEPDPPKQA